MSPASSPDAAPPEQDAEIGGDGGDAHGGRAVGSRPDGVTPATLKLAAMSQ